MGDFQKPMQHLLYLASIAPVARVMIKLDNWAPAVRNGREVQTKTVLGPALSVTSLPDIDWHFGRMITAAQPQPNVAMTLFRNPDSRAAEVFLQLLRAHSTAVQGACGLDCFVEHHRYFACLFNM